MVPRSIDRGARSLRPTTRGAGGLPQPLRYPVLRAWHGAFARGPGATASNSEGWTGELAHTRTAPSPAIGSPAKECFRPLGRSLVDGPSGFGGPPECG